MIVEEARPALVVNVSLTGSDRDYDEHVTFLGREFRILRTGTGGDVRAAEESVRKFPKQGDISCRSALTIHRGTTHPSPIARPVFVLGVDAPGAGHAALHDMMVTPAFYEALPESVRARLVCKVVDELTPVTQKHDIEGLVMGVD